MYCLVYCKNIPVEYASLTLKKSFLEHEFPSACKSQGQRFGCVITKPLFSASSHQPVQTSPRQINNRISHGAAAENSANHSPYRSPRRTSSRPSSIPSKLIVSSELSSIVELAVVAVTQFDCLRFVLLNDFDENNASLFTSQAMMNRDVLIQGKRLISERLQQQQNLGLNIFPLFEWIVIDQQCFDMSSVQKCMHRLDVAGNITFEVKLSKERHLDHGQQTNNDLKVSSHYIMV